ncbi:MAG: redoxin domain-containing protein [Planctomycetaceae bacterium]|nr:redoxin domain-containing protein [Planctomycetales bacterium]MCB9921009.1 redoxin domain-containing protein [Planctomycetaceae bacterium]
MRWTNVVLLGFGFLVLSSCSKSQQPSQVASNAPSAGQPDSHELAGVQSSSDVHAEHGSGDVHQKHTHETASHHESHEDASTDRHGGPQTVSAGMPHHDAHGHGHGDAGYTGEEHAADHSKSIAVGDKVPDFEVTINGGKFKLSELQKDKAITENGTLVLTFWCSFCHSCRDVEHDLNALASQYKGKAGVIALDASAGETTDGVAEFAKENELTLPIALNTNGTAADIFGVRVTTTTVVIDGDGVLRYCGRFGDDRHAFAADALKAVLAGEDVPVEKSQHKG